MARISLLLSLAFTLSLGSLFLSVSSLTPPIPLCPKTVSELQTLPLAKITEILNHKEKFSLKTAEMKAMFTACKDYVEYLQSLNKYENRIVVGALGIAKTKYTLTTKAILAVQASIIGKVDKKTSLKLMKSCDGFTKGLLHIQKAILKISAKHNYKADANISFRESKKIGDAVLYFRNSINDFMDLVNDFEEKKMKKVVHLARALKEDEKVNSTSDQSSYDKYFQFFSSFLEGKQHGRELTEAQADGKVSNLYEKFSKYIPYLDDKAHERKLLEDQAGAKNVAQAGGKINNFYEAFSKYMPYLGGKDHGRKLLEDQAGVNAGAQGSEEFKGSFENFSNFIAGTKVQRDTAGKI